MHCGDDRLCGGAACTLGVIDSDEFPMAPMVGAIALVALSLIWTGFALLRSGESEQTPGRVLVPHHLIGTVMGSLCPGGQGVPVDDGPVRLLSSGMPLLIWIVVFLLPGVLPTTAVAFRVVNRRLWTGCEHLEPWEREDR